MASLKSAYADAGVDRAAADQFAEKIGILAKGTLNRRVKSSAGGYASLFELDRQRWIAASTDGVGTKLKLAFRLGEHSTVGIDLVAMSVNDLLCVGAEPLFFLDYFATGKLDRGVGDQVIAGVIEGCRQAGCALVGGETAEMPSLYAAGEYDLAGFAVGFLKPKAALPRQKEIRPGDALIGVASSGFHSNGFSLLRKWIPEGQPGDAIAWKLLAPTTIYAKALKPVLEQRRALGMAHITGSGFLNVPRISDRVSYEIELPPLRERAEIFHWLRDQALPFEEAAQTFNLGIGMVIAVRPTQVSSTLKALKKSGSAAWEIGVVTKKRAKNPSEVRLRDPDFSGEALLRYE